MDYRISNRYLAWKLSVTLSVSTLAFSFASTGIAQNTNHENLLPQSAADLALESQNSETMDPESAEVEGDPEVGVELNDAVPVDVVPSEGHSPDEVMRVTPRQADDETPLSIEEQIFEAIEIDSISSDALLEDGSLNPLNFIDIVKTEAKAGALVEDSANTPEVAKALFEMLLENQLGLDPELNRGIYESYLDRKGALVFVTDPQNIKAVEAQKENIGANGLPEARYQLISESLKKRFENDPIKALALEEIEQAAFLHRYSRDMERGIVDFSKLGPEFDLNPESRAYTEYLPEFQKKPADYFTELEPKDPDYAVLKSELAKYRNNNLSSLLDELPYLPTDTVLKLGSQGESVGILRKRLAGFGFEVQYADTQPISLGAVSTTTSESEVPEVDENELTVIDPSLFDEELAEAVKEFQAANGLTADGIAGRQTLSRLNGGPEAEAKSILLAMERLRWGPQSVNGRQIYVNIANFTAEVRDDNEKSFGTKVVVGKNDPKYRTPEFHDEMEYVVINPRWNVPYSIMVNEFLPRLKRGGGLSSSYKLLTMGGKQVNPANVNFGKYNENNFPFQIVQESGGNNALGRVKFIFPNKHNIYLHDTPAKGLFSENSRAFSHGCVRVGDPVDLATLLLSAHYSDPRATFDEIVAEGSERFMEMNPKIPVFLTYFTTFVDDNGLIQHVFDIYDRDPIIMEALRNQGLAI